eukprot:scaffold1889_cov198-Amphora_coffeaeformis.AAC.4
MEVGANSRTSRSLRANSRHPYPHLLHFSTTILLKPVVELALDHPRRNADEGDRWHSSETLTRDATRSPKYKKIMN